MRPGRRGRRAYRRYPDEVNSFLAFSSLSLSLSLSTTTTTTTNLYYSILTPACADIVKQYKSPLTGQPVLLVTGGGVNDGRSLASALMLGASGVWVGTRFTAAAESKYPESAKKQ